MPALSRGESSSCSNPKLDLFTKVNGVLADIAVLEFQVFEKVTTPGTPIQVYPTTPGTRQSVDASNLCPVGGKISTGHYHADYTVPPGEITGTHEVRWFFRLTPSAPEQQFFEEFEVLAAPQPFADDTYISVADVRAAGVNSNPPTDSAIQASICLWQSFIERATRQWFRPIALELYADGTDSDALHFGVPIISIDELRINDETSPLDPSHYRVYNATQYPADRQNPRIKLRDEFEQHRDIYTAPMGYGRTIFRKGRQNQYVKGTFGYVEADGSAPPLIKHALTKLVVEKLAKPVVPGSNGNVLVPPILQGIILEEETDNHRVRYAQAGGTLKARAPGLAGITSDQEILDIIRLYKAPIGIATPSNPSYR
jgi:hypothetical protein